MANFGGRSTNEKNWEGEIGHFSSRVKLGPVVPSPRLLGFLVPIGLQEPQEPTRRPGGTYLEATELLLHCRVPLERNPYGVPPERTGVLAYCCCGAISTPPKSLSFDRALLGK